MKLLAFVGILCLLNGSQPVPVASAQPTSPASPPAVAPGAASDGRPSPVEYRVMQTYEVGGKGGWDYVSIDPEARRLYVPRSTRVMVLDADSGEKVGEILDTDGVHGVALAPDLTRGFTSNGRNDSVTAFDLRTLRIRDAIKVGRIPDAIAYEPTTRRVFVFNGRSDDATIINAEELKVVRTIPLGGKPEFAVVDGKGKVFVNIEDKSEVLRIDAATMKIEQRMPLSPGTGPTGLAIDPEHHRLFSVCRNELMVILDSESGKVLATPPIGKGVDGVVFDAASGNVLSANGEDGTITVVATTGEKPFAVTQTLTTAKRARTICIDPKTRRIYLPTAIFEQAVDPSDHTKGATEVMRPDTFKVLVVGP